VICKNCGLIAGTSSGLFGEGEVCGGCGYSPPEPVKEGQIRRFLYDIKITIPYTATLASKGDEFIVETVKKVDTEIKYKGGKIKELNTKYILEKTEVVKCQKQ